MRIGAVGRSERDHQLHPTRAGLLMFGEWTGNVYDFWHRASRMLTEGLPVPFRLGPDMRRIDDTPQHRAVREALTNALVHADYFGRTGVVLVRKPDRIIASNPGTLRIPLEEVEAGGVSDPRNRTLLFMFSLLDIGERAGSGYDVLREGTYSAGDGKLNDHFAGYVVRKDLVKLVMADTVKKSWRLLVSGVWCIADFSCSANRDHSPTHVV